jgi:hypothetical protein
MPYPWEPSRVRGERGSCVYLPRQRVFEMRVGRLGAVGRRDAYIRGLYTGGCAKSP